MKEILNVVGQSRGKIWVWWLFCSKWSIAFQILSRSSQAITSATKQPTHNLCGCGNLIALLFNQIEAVEWISSTGMESTQSGISCWSMLMRDSSWIVVIGKGMKWIALNKALTDDLIRQKKKKCHPDFTVTSAYLFFFCFTRRNVVSLVCSCADIEISSHHPLLL